jgi:hypothetical protein
MISAGKRCRGWKAGRRFIPAASPMSCNATYAAIEKLRSAGAVLEELALAELDEINWTAINTIMLSEGPAIFADLVARFPDRTSDVLKKHVETGKTKTALDYLHCGAQNVVRWFPR